MNKKEFIFIYKTTCISTGLIYIGSHRTNNLDDGYIGSGRLLVKDISFYGRISFTREILQFCDEDERAHFEKFWIKKLKSFEVSIGYNLRISSAGGNLDFHSDESKRQMSLKKQGKRGSEKFCRERSLAYSGEGNPNFGKHLSQEAKSRIGIANSNISEEEREKRRVKKLESPILVCPHCGFECNMQNAYQWHFDNCPQNPEYNKEKFKCEHCGFESRTKTNIIRWHNDNCKFKKENKVVLYIQNNSYL